MQEAGASGEGGRWRPNLDQKQDQDEWKFRAHPGSDFDELKTAPVCNFGTTARSMAKAGATQKRPHLCCNLARSCVKQETITVMWDDVLKAEHKVRAGFGEFGVGLVQPGGQFREVECKPVLN